MRILNFLHKLYDHLIITFNFLYGCGDQSLITSKMFRILNNEQDYKFYKDAIINSKTEFILHDGTRIMIK